MIDSSVLIDCLRGGAKAIQFIAAVSAHGPVTTHVIVAAELFAGARNKHELNTIESFVSGLNLIAPIEEDAYAALDLFKKHRLSHGVDWPDCQIAATALRLGLEINTLNTKHFGAFPGLRLAKPY